MTTPKTYEDFKSKTLPELAKLRTEYDSPRQWAQLAYEEKLMEQQDKYTREQIELQHRRNAELVKEQVKWIKYSAILTAVSTLTAGISGALLTYMLTRPPQQQMPMSVTPQITQPRIVPPTSADHFGKTSDKVPISTPPHN